MALLKWVLKMCRQKRKRSHLVQRQNTGYEEVTSTRETSESQAKCESMFQNEPIFQSETTTNIVHETIDENDNKVDQLVLEDKCSKKDDNENCDGEKSLSGETGAQEQSTATATSRDTHDEVIDDKKEIDQTLETLVKGRMRRKQDQGIC